MWTQGVWLSLALVVGTVSCIPESRIVNGINTDIENYPFMVSLRDSTGWFLCGAIIISSRFVLTAAHCVKDSWPNQLSIQYGVTNISAQGPNVIGVNRIIIHYAYNQENNYANDIALIELRGHLVFNYRTISPVTLPYPYFETNQDQAGSAGILCGWGLNATDGYIQSNLQKVDKKIYSDAECNRVQFPFGGATTKDQICGAGVDGGSRQCSGDSGGPLLYRSVLVGIVSWSIKPCGVAPYPGVYTKVSHYINWINQNTY